MNSKSDANGSLQWIMVVVNDVSLYPEQRKPPERQDEEGERTKKGDVCLILEDMDNSWTKQRWMDEFAPSRTNFTLATSLVQ